MIVSKKVLRKVGDWQLSYITWETPVFHILKINGASYRADFSQFQKYLFIENVQNGKCDYPTNNRFDYPDLLPTKLKEYVYSLDYSKMLII